MILVRTVFQAKFGQGGQFAAQMAASNRQIAAQMAEQLGGPRPWRVLTDLSGLFDTVVFELELESLAEWEQSRAVLFQLPTFQEAMAQSVELLVGGRTEHWTIEAAG